MNKQPLQLLKEPLPIFLLICVCILNTCFLTVFANITQTWFIVPLAALASIFFVYVINETIHFVQQKQYEKWQKEHKEEIDQLEQEIINNLKAFMNYTPTAGVDNDRQSGTDSRDPTGNQREEASPEATEEASKNTIPRD